MRDGARSLVLDVSVLFEPAADAAARRLAAALMDEPTLLGGLVRLGRSGIEPLDPSRLPAATATSFDTLRRWLLGEGSLPSEPARRARPAWLPLRRHGRAPDLPREATLLKPGLHGWDDPAFEAWIAGRRGWRTVAFLDAPTALDWPEYVAPSEVAAVPRRLAALARMAQTVLVPDETARQTLAAPLARGAGGPDLIVAESPSALAGGQTLPFDHALAASPFFLAVDRVEARANTALLLHVWRDLIAAGGSVPKLVLAGARGAQVEEIKPLLEWNGAIHAAVAEVGELPAPVLRYLATHACAVLAPAFSGGSGALLRDLDELSVPTMASDIAAHAGAGSRAMLLDPIDGRGWRGAIAAAAQAAPRQPPASAAVEQPGALARFVQRVTLL